MCLSLFFFFIHEGHEELLRNHDRFGADFVIKDRFPDRPKWFDIEIVEGSGLRFGPELAALQTREPD
jgi:hypothetical protein